MNLTIVAHYGPKSASLRKFIRDLQATLEQVLPVPFEPYREEQVHGTIIGLEGVRWGSCVFNQNYLEQKCLRAIHFPQLFEILKASRCFPFTVQIGGYDCGIEYLFKSRGQHPHFRSFSIQGAIAVVVGWPASGSYHPLLLDQLRRSLNPANVLHKYHALPADIDNDFFLVLGRINRDRVSDQVLREAQEQMRSYLGQRPFFVPIDRNSLKLVAYDDTRLPWGSCSTFTLEEAEAVIPQLMRLYGSGQIG